MKKNKSALKASHSAKPEISQAEATAEGIMITYSAFADCANTQKLVAYKKAVTWLNEGRYDYDAYSGLHIAMALIAGTRIGYIKTPEAVSMAVYCWVVSIVFFDEQARKNGVTDIPDSTGGIRKAAIYAGKRGAISVYPLQLREMMNDAAKDAAIKNNVGKEHAKMATMLFTDMIEPHKGYFRMSSFGDKFFRRALNGLISHIQNNGGGSNPVKPTIN